MINIVIGLGSVVLSKRHPAFLQFLVWFGERLQSHIVTMQISIQLQQLTVCGKCTEGEVEGAVKICHGY